MNPLVERYKGICVLITPVGSRVTCVPAPTSTDEDYLALVQPGESYDILMSALSADGWELGGSFGPAGERNSPFQSFRAGDLNLIVTDDEDFHNKFLVGTALAKRLNVLDKADRKAIFQAVLYGKEHNVHTIEPLA
jgi:hypothetical protein